MDLAVRNQRETVRTVALLLAIPVVLTLIHIIISPATRSLFVFEHSRFRVYTLWTAAFVHRSWMHLINNLVGYGGAAIALGLLTYHRETQRGLQRTMLVFLGLLPPLISLVNYAIFGFAFQVTENAATRGFSGIVSALFGLLFVVSTREIYLTTRDWKTTANYVLATVLFTLGGIVLLSGIGTAAIYGGILLASLLSLASFIPRTTLSSPSRLWDRAVQHRETILFTVYASLILVYFMPQLFPLDWIGEQRVTNIFGHFAGLCFGLLVGTLSVRKDHEWQVSRE